MKKLLVILLAFAGVAVSASAQMRTAYFMEGTYFRTDMNPALAPTRGYIALPALGGVGVSLNNNFLSVDNFIYKKEGQTVTALHGSVSADEFLKKLPGVGMIGADANVNLLGIGFHTKKMFWNFGVNARLKSEVALSKYLFSMLKSMNSNVYSLSDTCGANADAFAEVYLGFALPIKEIATLGVRLKALVGIANVNARFDSLDANIDGNSVAAQLRGMVNMGGPIVEKKYITGTKPSGIGDFTNFELQYITNNLKSLGAAIDLGTEVRLLDNRLRISVAVTDLGFIKWSGKTVAAAEINGDFLFEGVDLENASSLEDAVTSDFSFLTAEPDPKGYMSRLACDLNVGVEYNILNNHIAFGLLSHTRFGQRVNTTELTASVNFRLGGSFTTTVSHTFLNHNKLGVFGFALNAHPAGFNLFLGVDYIGLNYAKFKMIPVPTTMKSFNFYFGLGFNLGKAKYMQYA